MRTLALLFIALPLIACGGVSEKEARETLEGLELIGSAEPETYTVLLGSLCMESSTCAGQCREVLQALGSVAPADRITVIRQCDPNAKPAPGQSEAEAFHRWLLGYTDGYVKKVRAALPANDRPRLDKAWAALQK